MKLISGKNHPMFLSKTEWKKVFTAFSIIVISVYIVAMICSLCGSKYFILNYQNEQMDRIENFLTEHKIMPLLNWVFSTIEFTIILFFVNKRKPNIFIVLAFYILAMTFSATMPFLPTYFYTIYTLVFHIVAPVISQLINKEQEKFSFKEYGLQMARLLLAFFYLKNIKQI